MKSKIQKNEALFKNSTGAIFPLDIYPADGQPGMPLFWPTDAQLAANQGVACAEKWLKKPKSKPLWTLWRNGRASHREVFQLEAFDVAFMTRLQQRLRSHLGE